MIIAGILVINYRFGSLNSELNSIAETGVLARPLLSSATNLTDNFNDLTGSLGGALGKSNVFPSLRKLSTEAME